MKVAAEFVAGAASVEALPATGLPEMAFIGPSNSGKSSLVNALLGQDLARVSKTPGRTQQLNVFRVEGRIHLVDLPGYGFARVPREIQARYLQLVQDYLAQSRALRVLFVLHDCRREVSSQDLDLARWVVANGVRHAVVLTKIDKLSRGEVLSRAADVGAAFGAAGAEPIVVPFSSVTGEGRQELWRIIHAAAADPAHARIVPGDVHRGRSGDSAAGQGPARGTSDADDMWIARGARHAGGDEAPAEAEKEAPAGRSTNARAAREGLHRQSPKRLS